MKFILLIFCGSVCLFSCSQSLSEADLISRKRAEIVLDDELISNNVKGNDHIVFSVADKNFIVLVKVEDSFREYYIQMADSEKIKVLNDTIVQLSSELANSMFDKTKYKEGFITFNSDFYDSGYEVSSGNITYFVFKDKKGRKYGESRLSILIKPNPIDSSVYTYFVKRTIDYNR